MSKSRETADKRIDDILSGIRARTLRPNQLLQTVHNIPMQLAAALITGRPELVNAVPPPMTLTPDEIKDLYKFIGVLIETNHALQEHAHQTAHLVSNWMQAFIAMQGTARRIEHFANFRAIGNDEEEEA